MTVNAEQMRDRLLKRRDELKLRQASTERDLRHVEDPLLADSPERALQVQNDDVLECIDDAAVREIAEIDAALARIRGRHYGICSNCRKLIDPQRLLAVPQALTCVACSSR